MSAQPFLKWAGGKRQLLSQIKPHLPTDFKRYFEPFVGGGALLFELKPSKAIINDVNPEITNVYQIIKDQPEDLIQDLQQHENTEDYFYQLRALDRDPAFSYYSPLKRASRVLFLNKTCFNGLYRVNQKGQFNVPFGRYKNPNIVNAPNLRHVSQFLNHQRVEILNTDFSHAIKGIRQEDFVYFDPPYDPLSATASFTSYASGEFGREQQEWLFQTCEKLHQRGCRFLLSNSATAFIQDLYRDFEIHIVQAKRSINANHKKRGQIAEVLIKNY